MHCLLWVFPLKRDGDLLLRYTTLPLHLMEKPCHLFPMRRGHCSTSQHAKHQTVVVKHSRNMANPPRCCFSGSRPVFGLASVNKLQQPRGAVRGAETKDISPPLLGLLLHCCSTSRLANTQGCFPPWLHRRMLCDHCIPCFKWKHEIFYKSVKYFYLSSHQIYNQYCKFTGTQAPKRRTPTQSFSLSLARLTFSELIWNGWL